MPFAHRHGNDYSKIFTYEADGDSKVIEIDVEYVDQQLGELAQDEDMAKYIL